MKQDEIDICKRFNHIRKSLKKSQIEFAEELSSTQSIISDIERRKVTPSKNMLKELRKVFKVNIDWLLTGEGGIFVMNSEDYVIKIEQDVIRRLASLDAYDLKIIKKIQDYKLTGEEKEQLSQLVDFALKTISKHGTIKIKTQEED